MKNVLMRVHLRYHGHVVSYWSKALVVCSCGKQWVK